VTECIHVFLSTFEPGDWIFTNSFVTILPLEEIECHTLIFQLVVSMATERICKVDGRFIKT
jgi:hypothetical protein